MTIKSFDQIFDEIYAKTIKEQELPTAAVYAMRSVFAAGMLSFYDFSRNHSVPIPDMFHVACLTLMLNQAARARQDAVNFYDVKNGNSQNDG